MGSRRHAREATLQMLYLLDRCSFKPHEVKDIVLHREKISPAVREFINELFNGICNQRDEIDTLIMTYAQNWELNRMAAIDRNILRLATFEILAMTKTPISVIINEAVEIAKRYSTKDSGKFVNGILDKVKSARKTP